MIKGQHIFVAMQVLYLDWLQSHRSVCAMRRQRPQSSSRYQVPGFKVATIMENWELELQLCGPVFSPACTRPCISLQHPVGGIRKEKGGVILREIGGRYPCPICLSFGESINVDKPQKSKDFSLQKE